MARHRLTNASAPPATPGYQEPSNHPAAYPDPAADAYMNGDPSSWAEDPHPGPYPNTEHPALPGTEAPQGHPATDPAHYFPNGVGKQASRQVRAAMEAKAAKCIRIATAMLGPTASIAAIEDQALDLMNLTERQIQASLARLGGEADLLANYTLTEPRKADDDTDEDERMLAAMQAEVATPDAKQASSMEKLASLVAAKLAKMASPMPGNQNSPEHYNYRAEGVLASKKAEDEDEEKLTAMVEEEAKKAASKKGEDDKPEAKPEAKPEGDAKEEKAASDRKAAIQRLAGLEMSADVKAALEGLLGGFGEAAPSDEPTADDFMMDDLGIEDPMFGDDPMGMDDDLSMLYGMRQASDEPAKEEPAKEDAPAEDKEAAKKTAAVRPQPRRPSNGVQTLGTVAKTASTNGVDDLSKLWASAPDVSKVFGG